MELSIIIPTKDRGDIFNQTLRCAVEAIEHLKAEIIVVNDSKISKPHIPSNYTNVNLINNLKSGVASARNIGAKKSQGELLLFLDDDIMISRSSTENILLLHKQITNACINPNWEHPTELQNQLNKSAFGRFIKEHEMNSFRGWYNRPIWEDNTLFKSMSVASFHLSLFRKDFENSGGYNELFPHAGFEDYDFPLRLKKSGLTCYIDSRITVYHNESDTLKVDTWLNAQERRAITRKAAVNLGYKELEIKYTTIKKILLTSSSFFSPFILTIAKTLPNTKFLDSIYFKLISAIEAIKIYRGYKSL